MGHYQTSMKKHVVLDLSETGYLTSGYSFRDSFILKNSNLNRHKYSMLVQNNLPAAIANSIILRTLPKNSRIILERIHTNLKTCLM